MLWTLRCMTLFKYLLSFFFWIYIQEWNFWIVLYFYFYLFEEIPHCFRRGCTMVHSYQQYTRFPFLHILSNICHLQTFSWWLFWQVWGYFIVVLMINNLRIFLCTYWSSVFLLWKSAYSGLLPMFNLVVSFFDIEYYELLISFGY